MEGFPYLIERRNAEEKEREARTAKLDAELKAERQAEAQGKPDQPEILFAIFNRSGLSEKFTELTEGSGNLTYWRAGLFLLQSFLIDEANRDKYIAAAEALVNLPQIARSSLGFNLYLLGKMEQFRKNSDKAIHWFNLARSKAPLMYEHLMEQDPSFNLELLRDQLKQAKGPAGG